MAEISTHTTPELTSYQTALAILPPAHLVEHVNTLRTAYDKAYQKWPAHVNLVYPFVHPESLPVTTSFIHSALSKSGLGVSKLKLSETGYFTHKHSSTIFIRPKDDEHLQRIRSALLAKFQRDTTQAYNPHLTVGQAGNDELRDSLQAKARLLPAIEWPLRELAILVRGEDHVMRVWKTIQISEDQSFEEEARSSLQFIAESSAGDSKVQAGTTYRFDSFSASWLPSAATAAIPQTMPPSFRISSYNVLVDSIYPPAFERFEILVQALLADSARADVVVLQEVSDDFLCYLLRDEEARKLWPYASHAPPDQEEIGPLLSLRNIVILSRWNFEWKMVPFERRHKGALVVELKSIGKIKDSGTFLPLIIAGLHLTCGLTDGSVAAKKSQLRTLVSHLSQSYPESPWVVAGDFNMTTSTRTINDALKTLSISPQTARTLQSLEQLLSEAGLMDAWTATRPHEVANEDGDLAEGEEGATFDPSSNPLAAEIVGHGITHRPQRYDRILVKDEDFLEVAGFNMFGYPEGDEQRCGSDHWGVRATVRITKSPAIEGTQLQRIPGVTPPPGLDNVALQNFIKGHSTFPTADDATKRKEVFTLLEKMLRPLATADNKIPLVIVPVGSYGLDAWNTASDIDCLCISSISTKTFFTLAVRHLKAAATQGARILRKVEAHSGTMLELAIHGVRIDLQYCAAARIASW